jgi:WD40 repeat protein
VVAPGKTSQVHAELGDVTGDLEILTTAGAEIFLDGQSVGQADDTGKLLVRGLGEPIYQVRAALAGHSSEELRIRLAANLVSTINLELKLAEEANTFTTAPPPDYILQRRLASSEGTRVKKIFFQVKSGRLVSIGETGKAGYITQWDPGTGRVLETSEVKAVHGILAVSPDLRLAAVEMRGPIHGFNTFNSENSIQLLEVKNGRVVREWPGYYAGFTPDSKGITIQAWDHAEAALWDIESGKRVESWPEADGLIYSPDGRRSASRGGEGVIIRDVETGKTIQQFVTGNCCHGAAFSPDGRWLAVMDQHNNKIELWEVATGRQPRAFSSLPLPSKYLYFYAAVFTPDSSHIVSITKVSTSVNVAANPPGIRLLNAISGREVHKWPVGDPNAVALSPDGRWLAVLDNDSSITVWARKE